MTGTATDKRVRFLREIPTDPMTKSKDWGLRSVQDDADSTSWGGQGRLRRVLEVFRNGIGWHEIFGLVVFSPERVGEKMRERFRMKSGLGRRGPAQRGFTLLELMVVMAIIVILMTIATGKFQQMVTRAKEAALKSDLKVMRQAIQDSPPHPAIKNAALLRWTTWSATIICAPSPKDPITNETDWVTKSDDIALSPEQRLLRN